MLHMQRNENTGNHVRGKTGPRAPKKPARRRSLLLLALFSLPVVVASFVSPGFCAPVITGVEGTISDGSSISIGGSGFGAVGPNVVLFDDYEKGSNGSTVSTASGSAQVGQWSKAIGGITYSTAYAHSGAKSGQSQWANAASGNIPQTQLSFNGADRVFLSWWQYVPTNRVIPGTTNPSLGGTNWKIFWLWSDPFPQSDHLTVYLNDSSGPNTWSYALCGDDTTLSYNSGSPSMYRSSYLTKGVWNRYSFYFSGSPSSGTIRMYEVSATQGFHTILDSSGLNTLHSGQLWNQLTLPGYGRQDGNSQTYVDDVYVATGSGAQARVEIGDRPVYTSCTNLALATPASWSGGTVRATVRQGSFPAGESAYLFVVDSNGNASAGFHITLGSEAAGGGADPEAGVPGDASTPTDSGSSSSGSVSPAAPDSSASGTGESGGGGGGGCFIATAAFGSYLDPHVAALRDFRDRYLLATVPGTAFVRFYYRHSPSAASFIGRHDSLRLAARWALSPVVYLVEYPRASSLFLLAGSLLLVITVRKARAFSSVRRHRVES